MGKAAIFYDGGTFEQIVNLFNWRPHVKSGENWPSGFREEA